MKNSRLIDIAGQRFGRWSVINQAGNTKGGGALWQCRCDCGTERVVLGADLRNGKSPSCGCASVERIGKLRRTHAESGTRLHQIWKNMRQRCRNPSHTKFKDYGGRGITVCPEWDDFDTFKRWASRAGYAFHLTIDRRDVNGNYEPKNCRWIPAAEQAANRRFVIAARSAQ